MDLKNLSPVVGLPVATIGGLMLYNIINDYLASREAERKLRSKLRIKENLAANPALPAQAVNLLGTQPSQLELPSDLGTLKMLMRGTK